MCGIVIAAAFGKLNQRDEATRQRLMRYFVTELLLETEERGKDATGASVLFNDGKYFGIKRGERSSGFIGLLGDSKDCYGSFMKVWKENDVPAKVVLGHCRAGTVGDKEDNENNHPIKVGNLVGIHNGAIRNHDKIFKNLGCKRDGKVDSEAIFRMFDHFTNKGKEPFTLDMIQEIVNRIDGPYAISLFNADNLEQLPLFRDGRPVEMLLLRKYGLLFIVSEKKFWNAVQFTYERLAFYYSELLNVKLPSFLDKEDVDTKMLPDDSAMLFDLSKKVSMDTKIDDLGEWRKMDRTKKMWKAPASSTGYYNSTKWAGGGSYGGYNNYTGSATKKKDEDKSKEKKRRVFDNIKRKYRVKVGDKFLDGESAAVIPINDESSTKIINGEDFHENKDEVTKVDPKDVTVVDEDSVEQKPGKEVSVTDLTVYSKTGDDDKDNEDESKKAANQEPVDTVEVDMKTYSPEIVQATEKAYKELNHRGFTNENEVLAAMDVVDGELSEKLGMTFIANRLFPVLWKAGFMAGLESSEKEGKDNPAKKVRRESHISGLKHLIMLLTEFYEKSLGAYMVDAHDRKRRLASVVASFESAKDVDWNKLWPVFNGYEQRKLAEVCNVMGDVEKYVEEEKESISKSAGKED